jgi:hypothetical protein
MKTNAPYVKKYENGILVNPITKENPYLFPKSILPRFFRTWRTARNKYFTGRTIVEV